MEKISSRTIPNFAVGSANLLLQLGRIHRALDQTPEEKWQIIQEGIIAREYGLSAYDAAYLDVAVRHGVPLATLDSALQKAGRKAGIEIFKGDVTRE
jgi:predicted nucleic acid-binding protein